MNLPVDFSIEDVQNLSDSRDLAIDKVGIKALRHPIKVKNRWGQEQYTVAFFNMFVRLPQVFKGKHMSRFVEILNLNKQVFSIPTFKTMLKDMVYRLDESSGNIDMTFPYFVNKSSPVTGVNSLMDYEVSFIGEIRHDGSHEVKIKVLVPFTSLCPCSKKISSYKAHNQRSHVTVTAKVNKFMWIEEIIDLVESQASAQLYGLLKRPDEKFVTEQACNNPKFVEDMVRDIASLLNNEHRIGSYIVECENFESIHNHSAFAAIYGK